MAADEHGYKQAPTSRLRPPRPPPPMLHWRPPPSMEAAGAMHLPDLTQVAAMGMVPMERWLTASPMGMPSMDGSPAMPPTGISPMGAAPLLGPRAPWAVAPPPAAASLVPPRLNAPRQPKNPTTGLAKAARKKPGPKKKMPSSTLVASASTPTANSSASASIAAPNYGTEEDTHVANNMFDGMSASANSFSNMMDENFEVENISLFQPLPSADEEHDEDDTLISPTRKRGHRSANYSSDEDVALIKAWEYVSLDAIAGVDQSSSTFWSRISEHFHLDPKTTMTRTIGSLQHRWSTIQECCNKWKSCLAQVARQHPSGVPLQEQASLAQERYKAMDRQKHRPFTMQHCWTLLQNNQKWIDREFECTPKKPRSNCSSSSDFGAHEQDEGTDEMTKRPAGRKKEKERLKKDAGGYKEAIQNMIESKERLAIDKDSRWTEIKAIEERKVAIEERKAAAEERKAANEEERLRLKGEKARAQAASKKKDDDEKIMFMDTCALTDKQRAYVDAKRDKILAEILGGSGGGSICVST